MATIIDAAIALAKLNALLQPDAEPVLTAEQVSALLERHRIADVYDDGAAEYRPGAHVVPILQTGRWYVSVANDRDETYSSLGCNVTGTGSVFPSIARVMGARADDGTVTWQDDGPAPMSLWDIRAAAEEGWQLKAALVAGNVDVGAGKLTEKDSQAHAACLLMAQRYAPVGFA